MKIAIPRFGEEVAPCFEYSATITIFTVIDDKVIEQQDFSLQSRIAFDRVRLLRDQGVDALICNGVQSFFEDLVKTNGIKVCSWVSGNVNELLEKYIQGNLVAGSSRLGNRGDTPAAESGREGDR